ncbi:MAG: pilus assembly protein PilP [Deltaproteobacteria bacterium]|nr:pilus assembly protein PilP [Deltaproteobacteria bacterium]
MISNRKETMVLIAALCVAAMLGMVGCKKKEAPPEPPLPAKTTNAAPAVVQQPLSSSRAAAPSALSSDFATMKDPFKPFITVTAGPASPKKNRFGQIIPILNYDLSQFSVKGIIIGLKQNSALIVDPTGKPYVVKAGMEIGRNDGKITKITTTYIEVFEQYRDESGKLRKNTTKLMLPKKE